MSGLHKILSNNLRSGARVKEFQGENAGIDRALADWIDEAHTPPPKQNNSSNNIPSYASSNNNYVRERAQRAQWEANEARYKDTMAEYEAYLAQQENQEKEQENLKAQTYRLVAESEIFLDDLELKLTTLSKKELWFNLLRTYGQLKASNKNVKATNIHDKELIKSILVGMKRTEILLVNNELPDINSVKKYLSKLSTVLSKTNNLNWVQKADFIKENRSFVRKGLELGFIKITDIKGSTGTTSNSDPVVERNDCIYEIADELINIMCISDAPVFPDRDDTINFIRSTLCLLFSSDDFLEKNKAENIENIGAEHIKSIAVNRRIKKVEEFRKKIESKKHIKKCGKSYHLLGVKTLVVISIITLVAIFWFN